MEKTEKKKTKTTTIEISIETYNKLHSLKLTLEEIFKTNVSLDRALQVLLSPKIIDYTSLFIKEPEEKPLEEAKTDEIR